MKINYCVILLTVAVLAGCAKGAFHFTKGDSDGKLDGFTFNGIYSVEENMDDIQQVSLCSQEEHANNYPGWTSNIDWLDSINENKSPTDDLGSLRFFIGSMSDCFPSPADGFLDEFMFFVKSPTLENEPKWQGIKSFKTHVNANVDGVKIQLQAKVRKANGEEIFWKYKDSNGVHAFVDVPSYTWTPIVFEMENEAVTLLFISMKIIGDPEKINFGGSEGVLYLDAVMPKKN